MSFFGEEAGEDVCLGGACDADEGVDVLDAFFAEEVEVSAVAVDDEGGFQFVGELDALFAVFFDDFDVVVFFQQGGCLDADAGGSDDDDVFDFVGFFPAEEEDFGYEVGAGDHEDEVAVF